MEKVENHPSYVPPDLDGLGSSGSRPPTSIRIDPLFGTSLETKSLVRTTNRLRINSSTVGIGNVPADVSLSSIRYFFDGYKISTAPGSIRKLPETNFTCFVLVEFVNEVEASRALVERCYSVIAGREVHMVLYSCADPKSLRKISHPRPKKRSLIALEENA